MNHGYGFSSLHPSVCFLYYVILLVMTVSCLHPVCLLLSLLFPILHLLILKGEKAAKTLLCLALPVFLFTALINPAFSHAGVTILCYLPSGNPLTLESILYGIAAGCMIAAVLVGFSCFSAVMTDEKLLALFGKFTPSLALLLSMTLHFVPLFKKRFDTVRETQAALGKNMTEGSFPHRIKNAVACFSIVVTWSLESAVTTADSMKARGYGSAKRTSFASRKLTDRDKGFLALLISFALLFLYCRISGFTQFRYYPSVTTLLFDRSSVCFFFLLAIYDALPVILDGKELILWKSSDSAT